MIKEIIEYINNPKSSKSCFDLAEWYYEQKQFASALIYYLKVTEINDNDELTYFSLLKGGRGLHIQGYQTYQAKGMYLQAISVLPNRSEGWYWLSKIQTELGEWMEGYASSVTGYSKEDSQTSIDVEYSGKQSFLITQAECLIKFDRKREAIEIFISLLEKSKLTGEQRSWCELNMNTLWGNGWVKPSYYVKDKPLIFSFEDKNLIQKNYSQIFQDIFVLMVLNGKKNGTYLEIGAYEPEEHSNTKLLEKLGWKGLSLEIDVNLVNKFNGLRTNKCLWQDATTANYKELLQIFNFNKTID